MIHILDDNKINKTQIGFWKLPHNIHSIWIFIIKFSIKLLILIMNSMNEIFVLLITFGVKIFTVLTLTIYEWIENAWNTWLYQENMMNERRLSKNYKNIVLVNSIAHNIFKLNQLMNSVLSTCWLKWCNNVWSFP